MKTRNLVLAIIASAATFQTAKAQFSARLDLGYGFPSGTQTQYDDPSHPTKVTPYSYGGGFNIAIAGNYMFSDHIGAGLDLNMLLGTPVTQTQAVQDVTYTTNTAGSLFAITPNLILSAHKEGINPYGRFGIVLGVASITSTTTASGPGAPDGKDVYVFSGNLAVGWYAAFGVQFPLADNLKLNVELFDRDLTYAPATETNTQTYTGMQKFDTQTLVTSTNSSSAPNTQLTSYEPFGSVGLKVGIEMSFGK